MRNGFKKIETLKFENGQSIVEVVVAMAIFSIMATSMIGLLLASLALSAEGGKVAKANFLAQEGMEILHSIQARAWNELEGESIIEQIGDFDRTINFFPIYRNDQGEIASSSDSGAFLDLETKKISVVVSWDTGRGVTNTVTKTTILTNWDGADWVQNDWSGGDGQQIMENISAYDFDDGYIETGLPNRISLKEIATSTFATEGFIVSSAYDIGSFSTASLIFVEKEIPENCSVCEVFVQIQSAPDDNGVPGAWSSFWSGPNGEDENESDYYPALSTGSMIHIDHNGDRWFRYKLIFSGESDKTPVVEEIKINYKR